MPSWRIAAVLLLDLARRSVGQQTLPVGVYPNGIGLGWPSGLSRRWLVPSSGCQMNFTISGGSGAGGGYASAPRWGAGGATFDATVFVPGGYSLLAWAANATFPIFGLNTNSGAGGAASALVLDGPPPFKAILLAVGAGGGGGSATNGSAGGPPGGCADFSDPGPSDPASAGGGCQNAGGVNGKGRVSTNYPPGGGTAGECYNRNNVTAPGGYGGRGVWLNTLGFVPGGVGWAAGGNTSVGTTHPAGSGGGGLCGGGGGGYSSLLPVDLGATGGGGGSSYANTSAGVVWSNYRVGPPAAYQKRGWAGNVTLWACVPPSPSVSPSPSSSFGASLSPSKTPASTISPSMSVSPSPTPSASNTPKYYLPFGTAGSGLPAQGLELGLPSGLPKRWIPPLGGCDAIVRIAGGSGAGGGYSARPMPGGGGATFTVSFFVPDDGTTLLAWSANATFPPYGISTMAGAGGAASALVRDGPFPFKAILLAVAAGGGGGAATAGSAGGPPNGCANYSDPGPSDPASAGGGCQNAGGVNGKGRVSTNYPPTGGTAGVCYNPNDVTAPGGYGGRGCWLNTLGFVPGGVGWAAGGNVSVGTTHPAGSGGGGLCGGGGGGYSSLLTVDLGAPGGGGGSSFANRTANVTWSSFAPGPGAPYGSGGVAGSVKLLSCLSRDPSRTPSNSPSVSPSVSYGSSLSLTPSVSASPSVAASVSPSPAASVSTTPSPNPVLPTGSDLAMPLGTPGGTGYAFPPGGCTLTLNLTGGGGAGSTYVPATSLGGGGGGGASFVATFFADGSLPLVVWTAGAAPVPPAASMGAGGGAATAVAIGDTVVAVAAGGGGGGAYSGGAGGLPGAVASRGGPGTVQAGGGGGASGAVVGLGGGSRPDGTYDFATDGAAMVSPREGGAGGTGLSIVDDDSMEPAQGWALGGSVSNTGPGTGGGGGGGYNGGGGGGYNGGCGEAACSGGGGGGASYVYSEWVGGVAVSGGTVVASGGLNAAGTPGFATLLACIPPSPSLTPSPSPSSTASSSATMSSSISYGSSTSMSPSVSPSPSPAASPSGSPTASSSPSLSPTASSSSSVSPTNPPSMSPYPQLPAAIDSAASVVAPAIGGIAAALIIAGVVGFFVLRARRIAWKVKTVAAIEADSNSRLAAAVIAVGGSNPMRSSDGSLTRGASDKLLMLDAAARARAKELADRRAALLAELEGVAADEAIVIASAKERFKTATESAGGAAPSPSVINALQKASSSSRAVYSAHSMRRPALDSAAKTAASAATATAVQETLTTPVDAASVPEPTVAPHFAILGWVVRWDDSQSAYYFANDRTNETSWELPPR